MTGSRRILTVTLNPALDWNVEVDRVVREEKNRVLDSRRVPGGKGVNVSRVLERFDIDSRCFAVLGGTAGRGFAEFAEVFEVKLAPFWISGETRTNLTVVQRSSPVQIRLNHPGPKLNRAELSRLLKTLREEIDRAEIVVFSGSLPPGFSLSNWAGLLRWCIQRGKRVAVDADGSTLRTAAQLPIWLLKVNQTEWTAVQGKPRARWVVITHGSGGAELVGHGQAVYRGPKRRIRCTVGAGDSLLAGFLQAWVSDKSPEQALLHGVAAGTASVWNEAGELATRDDFTDALKEVRLERPKAARRRRGDHFSLRKAGKISDW